MQGNFECQLFVSREYRQHTFSYGGIVEKIKHCDSATTDFDLTGQIVWPASQALAAFIIDNRQIFQGKVVLQLGAGAGLSGIVCSRYAKQVILTDGNDIVVELLDINAAEVEESRKNRIKSVKFDWKDYKQFYDIYCHDLDIIIGADIMFWPSSMQPLCQCLNYMIEKQRKKGKQLLIYTALQNRSKSCETQFEQKLKLSNLKRVSMPLTPLNKTPMWKIQSLSSEIHEDMSSM